MAKKAEPMRQGKNIAMETVQSTPKIIVDMMAKQSSLNQAHRKLSEYVTSHFNDMAGIQSSVFAKMCGVSEPTVTRFVKEMGYKNYRDFQVEIAKASVHSQASNSGYRDIATDDNLKTICDKVFANNIQALADSISRLDMEAMQQAVMFVAKAERIIIYAQGRSTTTAGSFQHRLIRLGVACVVHCDTHNIASTSALASSRDLIIGISTFGRTRAVIEGMERARQRGAKTIAIASHTGVPIEQHADVVLQTVDNRSGPFEHETSCATVTQMVLLDCLYMNLLFQMKDKAYENLHNSYEALKNERL